MFSEYQQFSRTMKGEKVIHIQVCTVRRHFSEDKVMPLFSEQLVTDLQSWGLCVEDWMMQCS